ncbi:hypothetical protein OAS39_06425 [Pirellulales bacterium]|nr:hypothetical protein [Pirellulales bacterium]
MLLHNAHNYAHCIALTFVALTLESCHLAYAQDLNEEPGDSGDGVAARALRSFGDEPPPPLPKVDAIDMHFLKWLPRDSRRRGKSNKTTTEHAKKTLLRAWIKTPRLPDQNAVPELTATVSNVDFAPVDVGVAVVLLEGEVSPHGGNADDKLKTERVPIAVQLSENGGPLLSYQGTTWEKNKWFAAVELEETTRGILITFVNPDSTPVPTEWTGKHRILNGRFGGIVVDRKELVELYSRKKVDEETEQKEREAREKVEQEAARIAAMDLRDWKSKDGKQEWRAEIAHYERGMVTLRTPDSKLVKVKLRELSSADQRYVRKFVKALRNNKSAEKTRGN